MAETPSETEDPGGANDSKELRGCDREADRVEFEGRQGAGRVAAEAVIGRSVGTHAVTIARYGVRPRGSVRTKLITST